MWLLLQKLLIVLVTQPPGENLRLFYGIDGSAPLFHRIAFFFQIWRYPNLHFCGLMNNLITPSRDYLHGRLFYGNVCILFHRIALAPGSISESAYIIHTIITVKIDLSILFSGQDPYSHETRIGQKFKILISSYKHLSQP